MVKILKATGELEEFKPEKLRHSLSKAGAPKEATEEIIEHIQKELEEGMSTSQIYSHAFFLLEKKSKPAATRYSLRRAILELGPSGFPFEDFISEIFKEKGFETRVGQNLKGKCVSYEIDVIAYNENKLIMIEAKFHNALHGKTDLKTALYIKARFDDLKNMTFDYGGKRNFDENWVITNTKFTTSAINYGKCNDVKMVGWNYPKKGNLQDLIDDSGLHPLTCLTTLNIREKREFMKKGTVLCRKLKDDYNSMKSVGLSDDKIKEVNEEIALVCRI